MVLQKWNTIHNVSSLGTLPLLGVTPWEIDTIYTTQRLGWLELGSKRDKSQSRMSKGNIYIESTRHRPYRYCNSVNVLSCGVVLAWLQRRSHMRRIKLLQTSIHHNYNLAMYMENGKWKMCRLRSTSITQLSRDVSSNKDEREWEATDLQCTLRRRHSDEVISLYNSFGDT